MLSCTYQPATLGAYVAHVFDGRSMGDIAGQQAVERSTVCRRVQTVEAARQCPFWDEILERVELARMDPKRGPTSGATLSMADILPALDMSEEAFFSLSRTLHGLGPMACVVIAPGLDTGVIMVNAVMRSKLPRGHILAAFAAGVLELSDTGSKTQQFTIRPRTRKERVTAEARRSADTLLQRLREVLDRRCRTTFTADQKQTAFEAMEAMLLRDHGDVRWGKLEAALPPELFDLLRRVLSGERLEDIERAMGWSSRSARIVLRIALDTVAHVGALRT